MKTPNTTVPACEPSALAGAMLGVDTSRSLSSLQALEALRLSAVAADARGSITVDLPQIWHDLAHGLYSVVDDFFSEDRCYLVLASNANGSAQAVQGRRLQILEAVLSGLLQKNVAVDLALAPSTIALNSRLALESLGIRCKPSRAHPLLMLAVKASCQTPLVPVGWSSICDAHGRELLVIGAERPDRRLASLLPCAELAVIRRLVEGHSYAEIARERGTSTRTIANQITAVFRRLRVSGRNELVQRLFFDANAGRGAAQVSKSLIPNSSSEPKHRDHWRDARRSA